MVLSLAGGGFLDHRGGEGEGYWPLIPRTRMRSRGTRFKLLSDLTCKRFGGRQNEPYAKGSLSLMINETGVACVERIIIVIASGMVIPDAFYMSLCADDRYN